MIDLLNAALDKYLKRESGTDEFLSTWKTTWDSLFVHEEEYIRRTVEERNKSRGNSPGLVCFVICPRCGANDTGGCTCHGPSAAQRSWDFHNKTRDILETFEARKQRIRKQVEEELYPKIRTTLEHRVYEERNPALMNFYSDCCRRLSEKEVAERAAREAETKRKIQERERNKQSILQELSRLQSRRETLEKGLAQIRLEEQKDVAL